MGYDLHVTRTEDWAESETAPIAAAEWLAVVAADPELTIGPANGPYFAVWSGTGGHAESWFDWADGQVFTKNPTRAELSKLLSIAAALGGRVQGDDGECYLSPEDLPDDVRRSPPRPWWRFW